MAYSKVTLNGTTIMDVTQDTVNASNLLSGETATRRDGVGIVGEASAKHYLIQNGRIVNGYVFNAMANTVVTEETESGILYVKFNSPSVNQYSAVYTNTFDISNSDYTCCVMEFQEINGKYGRTWTSNDYGFIGIGNGTPPSALTMSTESKSKYKLENNGDVFIKKVSVGIPVLTSTSYLKVNFSGWNGNTAYLNVKNIYFM